MQSLVDAVPPASSPVVQMTRLSRDDAAHDDVRSFDELIAASPNLYVLKKRFAYFLAFAEFLEAKARKTSHQKPDLNAAFLDCAFLKLVKYVQGRCFGAAINALRRGSPNNFEAVLKRFYKQPGNIENTRRINELKTLRNLRPCVDSELMFCVEGRLENAKLSIDTRHPLILPGRR